MTDENIYVQMSLDSTQAAGKAERELLSPWLNDNTGNSIAIGHSEKSAIMHLKMVIIDGGSTLSQARPTGPQAVRQGKTTS